MRQTEFPCSLWFTLLGFGHKSREQEHFWWVGREMPPLPLVELQCQLMQVYIACGKAVGEGAVTG